MRVLYSFPLTLGSPGIGTTALQEIRSLVRAGAQVTVVCTHASQPTPGARVHETLTIAGRRIPHRAFGCVQRAYDYHDAVVATRLRALADRFDVVHVWPRGCLRTARAARRAGVPVVREVPSPHTGSAFEQARAAAREFGLELPATHSHAWKPDVLDREEREYAAVDALLVPSAYAAQTFVDRGFDPKLLLETRYGYDPAQFATGPRPAGRGLQAVFLGRGEPNKGLHHALRAWRLSGAGSTGTLHVCGRLWDPYAALLADDLAQPGVVVRGFVDAASILANADVLLLPTYTEGSALVVYEAMGSGCIPLVSTAAGAPVTDGVDALVHDVGDVERLASQLEIVAGDATARDRLRAGALASAATLTWDDAGRRLLEAYSEAVDLVDQGSARTRRAFPL